MELLNRRTIRVLILDPMATERYRIELGRSISREYSPDYMYSNLTRNSSVTVFVWFHSMMTVVYGLVQSGVESYTYCI